MIALLVILAFLVIGSAVLQWIDKSYAKKFPNSSLPPTKSYKTDDVFDLMYPRFKDEN